MGNRDDRAKTQNHGIVSDVPHEIARWQIRLTDKGRAGYAERCKSGSRGGCSETYRSNAARRRVPTLLDLNAFTTLIFYSMGYNLFTLRQASRRSWRINQTAPRVEVYLLYYADTLQAKAMKLMASKLAVAGIIEGTFSEEGLAAMSDVKDLTSQMAKELAQGIKDNVEDIAAAFKKMAIINPKRTEAPVQVMKPVETMDIAEVLKTPVEPLAADNTHFADAKRNQALYEGLLQKSIEERKTRKPKRKELENQLCLFGSAA